MSPINRLILSTEFSETPMKYTKVIKELPTTDIFGKKRANFNTVFLTKTAVQTSILKFFVKVLRSGHKSEMDPKHILVGDVVQVRICFGCINVSELFKVCYHVKSEMEILLLSGYLMIFNIFYSF
jgi:hypothetical protein